MVSTSSIFLSSGICSIRVSNSCKIELLHPSPSSTEVKVAQAEVCPLPISFLSMRRTFPSILSAAMSPAKLAPLLKRIEATDGLIDQIVYRLYGLTEDEIKIVEESISGNKDLNTKEDTKL
ncbi:MAG: hypothetical protein Q8O41_00690 [Candidatus Methanoperedens sp.]|nr:hypothetical protein [Candidatus Methanoperedens sp.]